MGYERFMAKARRSWTDMSGGPTAIMQEDVPLFKCSDPELSGSDGICTALTPRWQKKWLPNAVILSEEMSLEVIALNCSRVRQKGRKLL